MKLRAIILISIMAVLDGLLSVWMAQQSYSWFPPQASAEAKLYDQLFSIFVGLGTFIWVGVMVPIFYSLIFHRAAKYDASDGPAIAGSTTLEVIWTLIPVVIVLSLSLISYRTYDKMGTQGPETLVHLHAPHLMESAYAEPVEREPEEPASVETNPVESVDVTAKQWAWVFHYPEQDVTSTELHLPVDRRVRLVLRSEDVLHGFYVPAFRVKQDVVPNHTIDFEFTPTRTGTYRLRDSMYSGAYFAANQSNVVVQSPQGYQQWLAMAASQTPQPAYNQAADEYSQNNNNVAVRGWKRVVPAPPPVVNYAPRYAEEPESSDDPENHLEG
jgi:cytochrome c oxidase subunit 2